MAGVAGTLHLGTSGFAYDAWMHGVFYPEQVKAAGRLAHYASVFNSVEINCTFRRFPSDKLLNGWRGQVPDGLRFALKANQRITHLRRLAGAGEDVRSFVERAGLLGERLGPVLFQCPPSLRYDASLIGEFVDTVPPGVLAAMEFRHPSWTAARDLLDSHAVAWCVAETDEHDPAPDEMAWRPFGYLRLRRAAYSDAELAEWAKRIGAALAGGADLWCYFKHEDAGAGPRMARRLGELVQSGA